MANLIFTPSRAALNLLLSKSLNLFSVKALLVFLPVYFVLFTITTGLPVAAGIFVPLMVTGAGVGRLIGELIQIGFQGVQPPIDPSVYALVGCAAVLTGGTRLSITVTVVMIELTESK